jgi:hypothetical protein
VRKLVHSPIIVYYRFHEAKRLFRSFISAMNRAGRRSSRKPEAPSGQFPEGGSTWSMTSTGSSALAVSSFKPSCSFKAEKKDAVKAEPCVAAEFRRRGIALELAGSRKPPKF